MKAELASVGKKRLQICLTAIVGQVGAVSSDGEDVVPFAEQPVRRANDLRVQNAEGSANHRY
jgi:hypothetical protein